MIIIDGQEIIENIEKNDKNKLPNKKVSNNTVNNDIDKTNKTIGIKKYIKQFSQKILVIIFKIIVIFYLYLNCKIFLVDRGQHLKKRYYNIYDVLYDMLGIVVCFFSIFGNLLNLFKYEENYNMFEEFEKYERDYIHRKIKKRSNNGNNNDVIIDEYVEQKNIVLKADDIKIKNKE